MVRKKLLFIIPWLPYPLKSGGHMALFNGIVAVKDDFDIYIAFEVTNNEEYVKGKKGFLEIVPNANLIPLIKDTKLVNSVEPDFPLWYRFLAGLKQKIRQYLRKNEDAPVDNIEKIGTGWLYAVTPLRKLWLEHISKICSEYDFDIIQVEMPWLISQILTLPQGPRKIFVHHELGFVRRGIELARYNDQYITACRKFTDFAEIGMLNMYDGVITLSTIDKDKLIVHDVTAPVYASFSVVNVPQEVYRGKIDGKHLTFVGPDSHSPNFIGITWFLDNCWPLLLSKDDNYRLSIIGEWSEEHIVEYTNKYTNIEFLGFVDSLADNLKGTIMIVPITIGSGIRMKILEASSIGVPFVSTSVGAEGLPVENGKNCFIADDKEMFVNCILKLQETTIQEKFIENAHTMILEKFSIKALRENRLDIYKHVLNNKTLIRGRG